MNEKPRIIPKKEESQKVEAYFKAKITELTYQEATQKIVPMATVEDMLSKIYSAHNNRLKQQADRLASRLAAEKDENTIYQIILEDNNTTILESAKLLDPEELKKALKKQSSENPMLLATKIAKDYRAPLEDI